MSSLIKSPPFVATLVLIRPVPVSAPLPLLPLPPGCLVSAQLMDRLGTLRVIQLGTPLNLLAWPLMTLGDDLSMVCGGSVLTGMFVGLNAFGGRLYISEVGVSVAMGNVNSSIGS